jgi:hypothetical protein
MAETQVVHRIRRMALPGSLGRLITLQWMAGLATAVTLVVYVATALPGVSFGDWAEMQQVPARLEVPHETGFPLYVLLGKAFSLIPVGSVAFRATPAIGDGRRLGHRRAGPHRRPTGSPARHRPRVSARMSRSSLTTGR